LAEPLTPKPPQDLREALTQTDSGKPLAPPPGTIVEPTDLLAHEERAEPVEPPPDEVNEVAAPIEPGGSGACDVAACAAKYNSFDAADCTFQPFGDGSRQLCEIGPGGTVSITDAGSGEELAGDQIGAADALPADELEVEPRFFGADPETGEPVFIIEEGSAEGRPEACNIQACSAFYSSFRAEDCTYQPFDGGPRRLCER
jgi:hypothetical protein